jgi:uracil-DNA glycosylase
LARLINVKLTLVLGQYALDWHLAESQKATLTDTVQAWREYWPDVLPLPHPSPRNNIWLKRNAWFDRDVVSRLRRRVRDCVR